MAVHTRTVVADDRLRHERCRLAVLCRRIVDNVFEPLHPVRALNERSETGADFVLTGRCNFVMVHFDDNADLLERGRDRRTDVLE